MRKIKQVLGFVAISFAVSILFPGSNAFAQAAPKKATKLDTVIVTATRVKEEKGEVAANLVVLDREKIMASSAADLGELLAENSIGHIHKYPGTLTSIGIRGFKTETHGNDLEGHILILLNGRRVGTGNAAKIMTENIERVEIIRGPAAVQYGSAGMGGVVNVITRQGTDKPTAFIEGAYGSFNHRKGTIGFSGKVKGFDFSGSFIKEERGDYETANGETYHNTGYEQENLSLNLGYEIFPGNRVGIICHHFNAEAGSPGKLSQNDLDDYKETSNESIDFIYDGRTPNGFLSWKARYFATWDKDKWFDLTESNPNGRDDDTPYERNTDQKGSQAQMSADWETLALVAGADWVNYQIEATSYILETEYDNIAAFFLAKLRLLDRKLNLSGGMRYDEYKLDLIDPSGSNQKDWNLGPSMGVAYLLSDSVKIRAHYGEGFMIPSAMQIGADFDAYGTHYQGNPDLNPEKAKTWESGIDAAFGSLESSVTYFYTDYKDKIEMTTTESGAATWENLGEATIAGLEADLGYDFGELFDWSFEVKPYVNLVWNTKYEDNDTGNDLQDISDLLLTYGLTVSGLKGFSAVITFAYTGEQTNYRDNRIGGFTVANLTLSKKLLKWRKDGGMTLKAGIRNLLDKDYEYAQGYPMPGRSFSIGLKCDF